MMCALCGRKLKNQNSIELGYGPVCYKKICGITDKCTNKVLSENHDIPGQISLEEYLHNRK